MAPAPRTLGFSHNPCLFFKRKITGEIRMLVVRDIHNAVYVSLRRTHSFPFRVIDTSPHFSQP